MRLCALDKKLFYLIVYDMTRVLELDLINKPLQTNRVRVHHIRVVTPIKSLHLVSS